MKYEGHVCGGELRDYPGEQCALCGDGAEAAGDTERLEFLLQFVSIEDVGFEEACPGVVVQGESMEHVLGVAGVTGWNDDIRDVIDRAIAGTEQ